MNEILFYIKEKKKTEIDILSYVKLNLLLSYIPKSDGYEISFCI